MHTHVLRDGKADTTTASSNYFSTVPYNLDEVRDFLRDNPVSDAQHT